MHSFVSNLVSRHMAGGQYVQPRFRGKFEPPAAPAEKAVGEYFPHDVPAGEASAVPTALPKSFSSQLPPAADPQQPLLKATDMETPDTAYLQPLPGVTTHFSSPFTQPSPAGNVADGNFRPVQQNNKAQNATAPFMPAIHRQSESVLEKHTLVTPGAVNVFNITNKDTITAVDQELHTTNQSNQSLYFASGPFNRQDVNHIIHQHQHEHHQHTTTETPPVIKVTIGRIEVRAVSQPAPAKNRETPAAPAMSLDDFLKKRNSRTS